MAELTQVAVRLPRGEAPTKEMVRDIIGTILTKEWPYADPETITMAYRVNFANAHCPVERPASLSGKNCEPLKVFIKFHVETAGSAIEIFKDLAPSKQEEAVLCQAFGESGLGAKVHGFFQTQDGMYGRIDEFLEARNMEPEDVEKEDIRSDVARGLATFHALEDASLRKRPVEEYYEAIVGGLIQYHGVERLKVLGRQAGVDIDELIDYDFASSLKRCVGKLESIGAKSGWCIHDIQNMNIMVKNNPDPEESKVALIDFEFAMHNYRAFDIGGHFMQKLFKWFDEESRIASCRKYTFDEKRHFCNVYAAKWNDQTGNSDTGEQVLNEAEYGYLLAISFDIHNMVSFMSISDEANRLDLLGLNKLFEEFTTQCTKLGV